MGNANLAVLFIKLENQMVKFQIEDMTCGHCAGKITKAIKFVEADAEVVIDLQNHVVTVEGADAGEVEAAIKDAGYTPVLQKSCCKGPASHADGLLSTAPLSDKPGC
jgi:copper chaperone